MTTKINNDGVTARMVGAGPPLVLLHSLLSDSASFDAVASRLAERFTVIVPDLPGFGDSPAVEGGLTEVADRMAAFVRSLATDGKAVVFGNGYGAFVALQMAIRHSDSVTALILAGCGARFSEPGRAAFRNMAAAARTKGLATVADTAMARLFASDFQAAQPELMADRRAAFLRTDIAVFERACRSLATLDLSQEVAALTMPLLVMVGDQDAATPPAMATELAGLVPHADLRILPGCAHVPPLQAPDLVIKSVVRFLDRGL